MDFVNSPFLSTVYDLVTGIVNTGSFLFKYLFYSLKDWLEIYPDNWIFNFLGKITDFLGLDDLISMSYVDLIFSTQGIWLVFTILIVYFFIP